VQHLLAVKLFRICAVGDSAHDDSRCGVVDFLHPEILDSGEKKDSDVPYQEPESTKSSRQRVHTAQARENTLRTGSAIPDNPGIREVIPSTSVGWAFVKKESPSP
jgi:hypothetical protein